MAAGRKDRRDVKSASEVFNTREQVGLMQPNFKRLPEVSEAVTRK